MGNYQCENFDLFVCGLMEFLIMFIAIDTLCLELLAIISKH